MDWGPLKMTKIIIQITNPEVRLFRKPSLRRLKQLRTCEYDSAMTAEAADGGGRFDAAVLQSVTLIANYETKLHFLDLKRQKVKAAVRVRESTQIKLEKKTMI